MIKISPSILAADPLRIAEAACLARDAGCDELHFDVMDGHFVPNLSFGPNLLEAMKKEFNFVYDVHLMMTDPLAYISAFRDAGADVLTVHEEANDFDQCLEKIRQGGMKTSASIKPRTPTECLKPYLSRLDRVLLMTVEPGFGGQKLMPEVLPKARELRAMGFRGDIEADGGVGADNMALLADAGFTVLVMGTGFFRAKNPMALVEMLHQLG